MTTETTEIKAQTVIWKFNLDVNDSDVQLIDMPKGARVLHVADQNSLLEMWALVDPKEIMVTRKFIVMGTGQSMTGDPHVGMAFVGTALMRDGYVWHVFEIRK